MSVVMTFFQVQALSIDCSTMLQFASNLGMQSAQPAIWTQLRADCCATTGVYCVSQRVTQINWYGRSLNGFINSSALPSSVTWLNLGPNQLTGSLSSQWPGGLLFLELDGNQLSGDVPSFPSTLEHLRLGYPGYPGNHFTGTVRLNRPVDVMINYNWITDFVIQDTSALGVGVDMCDLSYNPLLGNTNIASLALCTKTGLYSAALLPITRSNLKSTTKTIAFNIPTSIVILTSFIDGNPEWKTNTSPYTSANSLDTTTTMYEVTSDLKWETDAVSESSANTLDIITTISELSTDLETLYQASIHETVLDRTAALSTFDISLSASTVKFESNITKFSVDWRMIFKVLLNSMILVYVVSKTPFRREMNRVATTWSFNDKIRSK